MTEVFSSSSEFIEEYRKLCVEEIGKPFEQLTDPERFAMLARLVAQRSRSLGTISEQEALVANKKRVFYFSLEFLIGPLLDNYLLNLGVRDLVSEGLAELGSDLDKLCAIELDPGLGNGGLGRLAACFLDSMAHEGVQGFGNGMRYEYGLFRQKIEGGRQVECADNWLGKGYPWEVRKPNSAVVVRFGGEVVRHDGEDGSFWYTWEGGDCVLAMPYDIPVVGYGANTVNKLRVWGAEPVEADFDLNSFNAGDYAQAMRFKTDVEAISMILYPNDSGDHGRLLRLKQEYLFVSAGLYSIIRTFKHDYGNDFSRFPELIAIHTNDTHPALCGPELMRILVDEEGLSWEEAWDITFRTISFTNHTVLPEALETWPIPMVRKLIPRTYMYIEEINRRYQNNWASRVSNPQEFFSKTTPLWDGQVRMANLSCICSHSINGVSQLHTDILREQVFQDFNGAMPERFCNKTNGVSHRRFMATANPSLAKLISEAIGEKWLDDADELKRLTAFENDNAFLEGLAASKQINKQRLAEYVKEQTGEEIDPNTIFDVQVKRFHAYKRQLLNVFKVLDLYHRLTEDPNFSMEPTTFIFSGKAAQAYHFAKEVIRLINSVADLVNKDPRTNKVLKVVFVPNFAVSNAQLIYPAAEISEQISTAGKEASGTSNMKLMMNGALTLGTYDGANIEIAQMAGEESMAIFGLRAEEVEALRASGQYWAWNEYNADRDRLGYVVDQLVNGNLAGLSGNFEEIHDALMQGNDYDLVLKDFRSYVDAWEKLTNSYRTGNSWQQRSLRNISNSSFFSSDRTIREYAREVWKIKEFN